MVARPLRHQIKDWTAVFGSMCFSCALAVAIERDMLLFSFLFFTDNPSNTLEKHTHPPTLFFFTHTHAHTMTSVVTMATSSGAATSQHSLRQQVRSQITEYSRLTNALFTSLDVLADGKAAPAAPNDIMKQIVQLDATLMGAVEKSMFFSNQYHGIMMYDGQTALACS